MRIKVQIKYIHCKKQKLNLMIYQLNLKLAKSWTNLWPHTQHEIERKLQKYCRFRYQTVDNKPRRLTQQQTTPLPTKHTFHHRVVNMTDISISEPEMVVLQKGPKYNINRKHKNCIQNLALVAETAISHLPPLEREVYRKLTAERINTLKKE